MADKRTHERVPFAARVNVFCKGKQIVGDADTRNISLKGVYVEADHSPGIGTPCGLELLLTGTSSKLTLNIDGRVVREDGAGFGLQFDTIDLDSYFHLKNILRYNAADSDILTDSFSVDADDTLSGDEQFWEDV